MERVQALLLYKQVLNSCMTWTMTTTQTYCSRFQGWIHLPYSYKKVAQLDLTHLIQQIKVYNIFTGRCVRSLWLRHCEWRWSLTSAVKCRSVWAPHSSSLCTASTWPAFMARKMTGIGMLDTFGSAPRSSSSFMVAQWASFLSHIHHTRKICILKNLKSHVGQKVNAHNLLTLGLIYHSLNKIKCKYFQPNWASFTPTWI